MKSLLQLIAKVHVWLTQSIYVTSASDSPAFTYCMYDRTVKLEKNTIIVIIVSKSNFIRTELETHSIGKLKRNAFP